MKSIGSLLMIFVGCLGTSCSDELLDQEREPNNTSAAANRIETDIWIPAEFREYRDHDYFTVNVPPKANRVTVQIDVTDTPALIGTQLVQIKASAVSGEFQDDFIVEQGVDSAKVLEGSRTLQGSKSFLFMIEAGGFHPFPSPYSFRVKFE
jgi:hypothetical protein